MTDIYSNKSALYYADCPRGMVLIGVVSNPGAGNIVSMARATTRPERYTVYVLALGFCILVTSHEYLLW